MKFHRLNFREGQLVRLREDLSNLEYPTVTCNKGDVRKIEKLFYRRGTLDGFRFVDDPLKPDTNYWVLNEVRMPIEPLYFEEYRKLI